MRKRAILKSEQPHMLQWGLKEAEIVGRGSAPTEKTGLMPVGATAMGVPHGVTRAIVFARCVRVDRDRCGGKPLIFFCESYDYAVVAESIDKADDGGYPDAADAEISTSGKIPAPGYYDARMRVSINGSIKVHIERFHAPKPEETCAV